jgi:hypothetical protein
MNHQMNERHTILRASRPEALIGLSPQELRDTFHISNLFLPGEPGASGNPLA